MIPATIRLLAVTKWLTLLLPPIQRAEAQSTLAFDRAVAYEEAIAIIAQRQAADDRVAVPGARSILLTRGAATRRAIVLLHGLTDSPLQFAPLAQRLYADGNNVFVPRLPHHGLRAGGAGALAALSSSGLSNFADSIAYSAAGLGDSVIVLGLSLGGTLAAWLAQQREIWRAVLIAPALEPGRIPALLDRPIVELVDHLPNVTRSSPPEIGRPDREPGFSTHAIAEIFELGSAVLRGSASMPPGTKHAVVLVNANDRTVKESAAEALARRWKQHGAKVSVFELPDSLRLPHNIVDPIQGRVLGDAVTELLRQLAYGQVPARLVRAVPIQ
jgi:esterase/lipase